MRFLRVEERLGVCKATGIKGGHKIMFKSLQKNPYKKVESTIMISLKCPKTWNKKKSKAHLELPLEGNRDKERRKISCF